MTSRAVFSSITMSRLGPPTARRNNSLSTRRSQNKVPRWGDLLVPVFSVLFTCTVASSGSLFVWLLYNNYVIRAWPLLRFWWP